MKRIARLLIHLVGWSLLIIMALTLNGVSYGFGHGLGLMVRQAIDNGQSIIIVLIGVTLLFIFVIASRRFGLKVAVNFASILLACLPAFAITGIIMSSLFHPSMTTRIAVGVGTGLAAWGGARKVGVMKMVGYAFSATIGFCGLTLVAFILWEMFVAIH